MARDEIRVKLGLQAGCEGVRVRTRNDIKQFLI